jgi:serine/threonine protein kinase
MTADVQAFAENLRHLTFAEDEATDTVADNLDPPYKLVEFDKVQEIGSGTFGSVALYRHRRTGTPVVIKGVNKMRTFAMKQQRNVLQERNSLRVCVSRFPFTDLSATRHNKATHGAGADGEQLSVCH